VAAGGASPSHAARTAARPIASVREAWTAFALLPEQDLLLTDSARCNASAAISLSPIVRSSHSNQKPV
jgi:hypothetical protein